MIFGRIKPLDSLARSTLKNLSGRETFKDKDGKTQPAQMSGGTITIFGERPISVIGVKAFG